MLTTRIEGALRNTLTPMASQQGNDGRRPVGSICLGGVCVKGSAGPIAARLVDCGYSLSSSLSEE